MSSLARLAGWLAGWLAGSGGWMNQGPSRLRLPRTNSVLSIRLDTPAPPREDHSGLALRL